MDKALKQRLVGASVLIILAVIVLPMLLSGRSDTLKQESRQIELPPKPEELSIETRRFPVGIPNKPAPAIGKATGGQDPARTVEIETAPTNDQIPDSSGQQGTGEVSTSENSQVAVNSSSNDKIKPPVVTSITLTSQRDKDVNLNETTGDLQGTPRYLVQVASFSSEKNANTLASELRADNLPVLMDVVERAVGRLHRVRVGPYAERAEADAVVASIGSKRKDVNPRVLDLRPTEAAPVSAPSDPLVRWVVQVGSFSQPQSAEAMVAELRLADMTAFSEKVSSSGGTVYKVQIGPELVREKAAELARNIKTKYPGAFVTTQE